jgi:hypothetical protein
MRGLVMILPSVRGATTRIGIGLATDVGVLILVAKVETEVVDDVACVLDNVGTLLEVARGSIAAHILEAGHVIGVGSSRKAGEDTLLRKEKGSSANGQDGTLLGGILLLQFGEVADEGKRLVLFLKDFSTVASENNEHVELLEAFVSLFVGDLRADNYALLRQNLGLGTSSGDFEGLGSYRQEKEDQ